MHTSIKKSIMIIALLLLVGTSVFAVDGEFSNRSFRLYHMVNTVNEYSFRFWSPDRGSTQQISSRELVGSDAQQVAALVFIFTTNDADSTYTISSLQLKVSDLYMVNDDGKALDSTGNVTNSPSNYVCYPFDIWVTDASSDAVMGNRINNKHDSNGSLSIITLISNSNPRRYTWDSSEPINIDEIARIWVEPHIDEAAVGNYQATITIEMGVN